jgi:hypothetical protein
MSWGNAISEAFKWFSPDNRRERVEDGLISTLDGLTHYIKCEYDLRGKYSDNESINKYIDHYMRQYEANRKKLK